MRFFGWTALALVVLAAGFYAWLPPVNVPLASVLSALFPAQFGAPRVELDRLHVVDGYALSVFMDDLVDARIVRATSDGDLLVVTPRSGQIWWLKRDGDGDGAADERRLLKEGLVGPNGIDLNNGYLYVAEETRVGRIRFDSATGSVSGNYEIVIEGLPEGGNHWKKTLRFGPDGLMYVAVGSSCNACLETDERRAALLRYSADGEPLGNYATGLRNSAGFDWSPVSGALFATDNGRDLLGDDYPPCELNRIEEGAFYGWPFANGEREPDPDLGAGRDEVIAASRPPVFEFAAHNAPLGIAFVRRPSAGLEVGAALVALHGSWNRTQKDGYKVVSLHWDANGRIEARDFLTGFLVEDRVFGRPAEIAEAPDGTIYVSDDFANAVYKIGPSGEALAGADA